MHSDAGPTPTITSGWRDVDRSDFAAILSVAFGAILAGFLLLVGAYTAGIAAGLAVQGFELVR